MLWFKMSWNCTHSSINTVEQILNQVLWLNSHIKVNGKTLYENELIQEGCVYVHDIINEKGFIELKEIEIKYNTRINWLTYRSLCNAIPRIWLKML